MSPRATQTSINRTNVPEPTLQPFDNVPHSHRLPGLIFLGLFSLVFGLLPTIVGFALANLNTRSWPAVEATVVSHVWTGDGMRSPVYEYTVNGQVFEHHSDTSSSHPRPIGATRELRVNPINASDARPFRPALLWMSLALPVGIGIGLFGYKHFNQPPRQSAQFINHHNPQVIPNNEIQQFYIDTDHQFPTEDIQ